jgi:uncharacterized membrane protein (DUF4010 family)
MEEWRPYIISSLIGLLVGIERERAQTVKKAMGVRTFLLIALLGALAGGLTDIWIAALIAAFTLAAIGISYFLFANEDAKDHGLTTEFAAAVVFVVSYISHQNAILSAILGPIVALVLFSKRSLHRFTAAIKASELQAAILILLLAVSVIGVLKDQVVDPWGIFNPRKFGLLVLTLAALEFLGYVLTKVWGERRGALVSGFLGGLVSSTAVLLSAARGSTRSASGLRSHLSTAVSAKAAALIELLVIVTLVSDQLTLKVAGPVLAGLFTCAISMAVLTFRIKKSTPHLTLRSPLEVKSVLKLATLLAAILAGVAATQRWLGTSAAQGLVFLTGLFELHGVSLATATMAAQNQVSMDAAADSIFLAVAASLIAKIVMAWIVTRGLFARYVTLIFGAVLLSVAAGVWVTNLFF